MTFVKLIIIIQHYTLPHLFMIRNNKPVAKGQPKFLQLNYFFRIYILTGTVAEKFKSVQA